jgi:hypothetical protein
MLDLDNFLSLASGAAETLQILYQGNGWVSYPADASLINFTRFRVEVQPLAVHPSRGSDSRQPVLRSGDSSQILADVLLSDVADRNLFTVTVRERDPEQPFAEENSFRVVTQRSVSEVHEERFRFVKPEVDS